MFLAADYDGLKIYNIENIENPIEIGEFSQGRIRFVEVTDNIAYIRNISPNELILLDISQPSTPVFITKIPMTIYPSSKFILNNNYAYFPNSKNLDIYDISNPASPNYVDTYYFDYTISSLFLSDNYIYVTSNDKFFIFDVSIPSTLTHISEYYLDYYPESCFVKNDIAYLSLGNNGLLVLDVFDKSSPTVLQLWNNGYAPESAVVKNNFMYVSDGEYGISIFDINDISNPKKLSSLTYDDYLYAYETVVTDEYAFIAADNYFIIADISNKQNPHIVYIYPKDGSFYNLFYDFPYLYTTGNTLRIFDVSDPSSPIVLIDNFENISGALRDLYVKDNIAYITNISNGLSIVDVTDPSSPIFIENLDTGYYTYDVFVEENYAYVISYGKGLSIIDITEPSFPATISELDITDQYNGIFVKDNYVYLAAAEDGLIIIDVSDPLNLNMNDVVKKISTYGALEVYVEDDYAYVTDYDNGIVIIDIQNPQNAYIKKDILYMYFYHCTSF